MKIFLNFFILYKSQNTADRPDTKRKTCEKSQVCKDQVEKSRQVENFSGGKILSTIFQVENACPKWKHVWTILRPHPFRGRVCFRLLAVC
jgi:hypothetical protein